MKLKEFLVLADQILVANANAAATKIAASPTQYGTTTGTANALATLATALQTEVDAVLAAKQSYDAAVVSKDKKRAEFAKAFQTMMTLAYANPAVLDEAFSEISLDPRTPRQVRPLTQPLQLEVVPNAEGYIVARWKRNGNSQATTFHLQQLSSEGEWEDIWAGPRIRAQLAGYTPGVQATFRVLATKGDETSLPSNTVVIYVGGGAGALRVAA